MDVLDVAGAEFRSDRVPGCLVEPDLELGSKRGRAPGLLDDLIRNFVPEIVPRRNWLSGCSPAISGPMRRDACAFTCNHENNPGIGAAALA